MTIRFLSVLLVALVAFASPALAAKKAQETCIPILLTINPSDTQTSDAINLSDGTITSNATVATAHAGEDTFLTNIPLKFSAIKAIVDVAPGTTGGTDTRTITVQWDPPGATALQSSTVTNGFGCTISGTGTTCTGASSNATYVPVGSTVSIRHSAIGSPSAPDAAAELGVAFCMTPSNTVGLGQ